MQARQGDIFFIPINTLPDNIEKVEDGIIARGEATGHTHRISDMKKAILYAVGINMYLKVLKETEIIHEEHKPITILPEGIYEIRKQVEYTPSGLRRVED